MAEKKEKVQFSGTEESALGNSLVAKWLGLHTFTAEGPGSIPGQGTKILKAAQHSQIFWKKGKVYKTIVFRY